MAAVGSSREQLVVGGSCWELVGTVGIEGQQKYYNTERDCHGITIPNLGITMVDVPASSSSGYRILNVLTICFTPRKVTPKILHP